jgi:hypothetical protein
MREIFSSQGMDGGVNYTVNNISEICIPSVTDLQKNRFSEKAKLITVKINELLNISTKFLALLKSEFGLDKLGGKLEQWYTLDFAAFVAELTKKKIPLTLAQKAEWMEHFEKQKAIASTIKATIDIPLVSEELALSFY